MEAHESELDEVKDLYHATQVEMTAMHTVVVDNRQNVCISATPGWLNMPY